MSGRKDVADEEKYIAEKKKEKRNERRKNKKGDGLKQFRNYRGLIKIQEWFSLAENHEKAISLRSEPIAQLLEGAKSC